METGKQFEELTQAIVKATEIKEEFVCCACATTWEKECLCPICGCGVYSQFRPITLEDVLRAHWNSLSVDQARKEPQLCITRSGLFFYFEYRTTPDKQPNVEWHLGHDLSWHRDNAPETITFLHQLLV